MYFVCSYTPAYFPLVTMSMDAYAMMMIMPRMTLGGLLTFRRLLLESTPMMILTISP